MVLALFLSVVLTVAFTLSTDPVAAALDSGGAQPNGIGWCRDC
jgi:hypothetical protein